MKTLLVSIFTLTALAAAAERKPLPNQAGNDDIEISGSLLFNSSEIQQAIGADPGPEILVVRLKAAPKNEQSLRIGPDDFTLIYRKDGQRSEAMLPSQIAGKGALVIKAAQEDNDWGSLGNGHGWTGVGGIRTQGGNGSNRNSSKGKSATPAPDADAKADADSDGKADPVLDALQAKLLPDRETKEPLDGLLYFAIDGKKFKAKDFSLIYKGPGGKLVMDFQ